MAVVTNVAASRMNAPNVPSPGQAQATAGFAAAPGRLQPALLKAGAFTYASDPLSSLPSSSN